MVAIIPPLISEGEHSAKYTALTINDSPMPIPAMSLPIIKSLIVEDPHIKAGPTIRKMSDKMREGFLPSLSANGPPVKEPNMHPRIVRLTKN